MRDRFYVVPIWSGWSTSSPIVVGPFGSDIAAGDRLVVHFKQAADVKPPPEWTLEPGIAWHVVVAHPPSHAVFEWGGVDFLAVDGYRARPVAAVSLGRHRRGA